MRDYNSFHAVDTSKLAEDDGCSVGDCCLPIQYAEGEEDLWTPVPFHQWFPMLIAGVLALAADVALLFYLGAF